MAPATIYGKLVWGSAVVFLPFVRNRLQPAAITGCRLACLSVFGCVPKKVATKHAKALSPGMTFELRWAPVLSCASSACLDVSSLSLPYLADVFVGRMRGNVLVVGKSGEEDCCCAEQSREGACWLMKPPDDFSVFVLFFWFTTKHRPRNVESAWFLPQF